MGKCKGGGGGGAEAKNAAIGPACLGKTFSRKYSNMENSQSKSLTDDQSVKYCDK